MAGESQDENDLNLTMRTEPKPWPGTISHVSPEFRETTASNRLAEDAETQRGRPSDRHAKLAVFRI